MQKKLTKSLKFVLILGLVCLSGFSCDEDEDERPEIRVSPTTVTVAPGEQSEITIGGGLYPYRNTEPDGAVATAALYGHSLKVTGVAGGETSFVIHDSDEFSQKVDVTVVGGENVGPLDNDGDGFSIEAGDCDDTNPNMNPDAAEICGDGIDQNCDGSDLACPDPEDTDNDGDGFAESRGDCNDNDPAIHPDAAEVCGDGIDQDCSGGDLACPDPADTDDDGDGFTENQGDCDDNSASIHPNANEICGDGIDQDCSGDDSPCAEPEETDNDGDGFTEDQGDCDDNNASVHPDADEICGDGIDQDCSDGDLACVESLAAVPSSLIIDTGNFATVTVSGGQPPYQVTGNPNAAVATANLNGDILTVTGVAPGTTAVTLSDNNADSIHVGIVVQNPPTPYSLEGSDNYVILGPIENAEVAVYRLTDPDNPIETTTTGEKGRFALSLDGVGDNEIILVTATGGMDIDVDDDMVIDPQPTPNHGTIHALTTPAKINIGGVIVSPISEMAWQYTRNLIGTTHPDDLEIRLIDVARTLYRSEYARGWENLTWFNPLNLEHRNQLTFDFADLLGPGSLTEALRQAQGTDQIHAAIEKAVGPALNFHPAKDTRAQYAQVRLIPFGKGKVTASSDGVNYDSPPDTILVKSIK